MGLSFLEVKIRRKIFLFYVTYSVHKRATTQLSKRSLFQEKTLGNVTGNNALTVDQQSPFCHQPG